jgi:hypothetical protein
VYLSSSFKRKWHGGYVAHPEYENMLYDEICSWRAKKEKAKTQGKGSRVMAFVVALYQEKRQAREKGANPLPVLINSNAYMLKMSSEYKKILLTIDK